MIYKFEPWADSDNATFEMFIDKDDNLCFYGCFPDVDMQTRTTISKDEAIELFKTLLSKLEDKKC